MTRRALDSVAVHLILANIVLVSTAFAVRMNTFGALEYGLALLRFGRTTG